MQDDALLVTSKEVEMRNARAVPIYVCTHGEITNAENILALDVCDRRDEAPHATGIRLYVIGAMRACGA